MLGKLIKKAPVNNVLMTSVELKVYLDCLLPITSMPRPDLKREVVTEKYYNLTSIKKLVFMALVIVQPTQCGVRRLVAAFGTMRRRVAALHKLTHRAER